MEEAVHTKWRPSSLSNNGKLVLALSSLSPSASLKKRGELWDPRDWEQL